MTEHVEAAPRERDAELQHLLKTDPDPRVRRRAHALLWVTAGHSQASAARLLQTSAYRVHVWQHRFDAEGRAGLVDRPRGGRPHALNAADRALLAEALDRGPQADGVAVTIWSIRDLHALLQREHGVTVSVYTVHRAVQAMGYR
jgi:transposase